MSEKSTTVTKTQIIPNGPPPYSISNDPTQNQIQLYSRSKSKRPSQVRPAYSRSQSKSDSSV
jgi:hypothetical protein